MSIHRGSLHDFHSLGNLNTAYYKDDDMNSDQLLAKLYALRKDYADDPEDETYQALHTAFMFISYNMNAFKEFVKTEAEKVKES